MERNNRVRARARPTVFFIAAAVHAALAVPVWVVTYGGLRETGLSAAWHGGEMIFGYAYAVFGGFFLTRVPWPFFLLLLALWFSARVLAFLPVASLSAVAALSVAYPLLIFGYAIWPFLRAAKRWRNAVFVPLLALLLAAAALHSAGSLGLVSEEQGVRLAFDLIVVMLFTMGGRFAAGAISGALQRQGGRLRKPAQPGLERAGLVCLVAIAAVDLVAPDSRVTGWLAAGAAVIASARLWFWQAWRVLSHAEVLFLVVGYIWLVAGLAARALDAASDLFRLVEADHVLAVGALGTLSMTVISRVARQRCGFPVQFKSLIVAALCLVSTAGVFRFLAAFDVARLDLLSGAAVCWSAAFSILAIDLFVIWRGARRPDQRVSR